MKTSIYFLTCASLWAMAQSFYQGMTPVDFFLFVVGMVGLAVIIASR